MKENKVLIQLTEEQLTKVLQGLSLVATNDKQLLRYLEQAGKNMFGWEYLLHDN